MIEIEEVRCDFGCLMPLLLMGDESEAMIERYLSRGRVFAAREDGVWVAVCVVTAEDDGWMEVKNLAVAPERRKRGIGRSMLLHVEGLFPAAKFRLGTGETPSTLRFYASCGYRYSHRIDNFFVDNYDHPIVEEGVRLRDMLYLVKHK